MKQQQDMKVKRWQYDITWEIKDHISLIQKKNGQIESQLKNLCEKEGLSVGHFCIEGNSLSFKLISRQQLNLHKWNKIVKKKLASYLPEIVEENNLMVSHGFLSTENDQRLSRLVESIREANYYDLEEGLIDEDVEKLKLYLKKQILEVIEQGSQIFLIDHKALKAKINLNCFECTKRHQYGCCCGSPCAMSQKNMSLLDKHLLRMEEALKSLDEKQYKTLQEKGGFVAANGEIKAFDGHCSFLIAHEGVYKCMAHKYALDENIPIYDLCPLSCLMYPLEIMELVTDKRKTIVLITAATKEEFAKRFSRWGSYQGLGVELRCIHEDAHDEGFRKEDYKTVYEVNQNLLQHEFGANLLKGMKFLF